MVSGLERHQREGHLHFVTFGCYHRLPYLDTRAARHLVETALERARRRYEFAVIGYVVMPEYVHVLVSEPAGELLAVGIQAVKLSVAKRAKQRPFWQARYYDFNVFTEAKRIEKLDYMHANPIKRGLVDKPEDWLWSSYRSYRTGEQGRVRIA